MKSLAPLGLFVALLVFGVARAQPGAPPPRAPGPEPTFAGLAYAEPAPAGSQGHLLDLYLPPATVRPAPLVIFTAGSAWLSDNGRNGAQLLAVEFNKAGYAVAGVSIRSSSQAQFPAQLHDMKAAVRWLRANAARYNIDPARIGIVGDSSGGWTSAMTAVTGDVPELEGAVGVRAGSSAVQAAIAFYPPTDFLQMDRWALRPCDPSVRGIGDRFCHDSAESPESRLIGCAIQTCPDKVQAANPVRYISAADPPILVIHGDSDALVPRAEGALFYQALSAACHESAFVSIPLAPHGGWNRMVSDAALNYGATIRSTAAAGCTFQTPAPYQPTWRTLIDFFDRNMKPSRP